MVEHNPADENQTTISDFSEGDEVTVEYNSVYSGGDSVEVAGTVSYTHTCGSYDVMMVKRGGAGSEPYSFQIAKSGSNMETRAAKAGRRVSVEGDARIEVAPAGGADGDVDEDAEVGGGLSDEDKQAIREDRRALRRDHGEGVDRGRGVETDGGRLRVGVGDVEADDEVRVEYNSAHSDRRQEVEGVVTSVKGWYFTLDTFDETEDGEPILYEVSNSRVGCLSGAGGRRISDHEPQVEVYRRV